MTEASGQLGGGMVLVGGNWQGSGPEQNAKTALLSQRARISVDALENGSGGAAVFWSDMYTKFDGTITARGGVQGGDGGQIQTASHGTLVTNSVADASARAMKVATIMSTVIEAKSPSA